MAAYDKAFTFGPSSTYDVFLSFRGEDTRNNFTGFLYSALKREGINVFIDSESLWGGEEIQTALLDAIQQSKISIPVFSKGYADSKWCLMELVEINRCHGSNGQKVLPIFLDVEPRDVRHQTGSFKGLFQKHMEEKGKKGKHASKTHENKYDAQKIQSWRDALTEVAGKKGYELKQVNWNQAELVKLIVDWALSELSSNCLSDVKNPVGLDARVEDLLSQLKVDSNDVRYVGICGISGMGKTTIATALYNRIFKNFDMSCFLASVREEASSGPNGVVSLQEKLIYSVSKKEEKICIVQRGKQLIKEKLHGKKVLLVLDDVDSYSQLKDLAIDSILFGQESRIIITTKDKQILDMANVDNIYKPKELDDEQSLQLFSLNAFSSDRPPEEYLQLSRDVIQSAGGLPLTLEVLGSSLLGEREKEVWQSMAQELKGIPHDDVYTKLRISYDKLNKNEKSIFLDAACFFVGGGKKSLMLFWEACGFNPLVSIKSLTQKSLIKFTPSRCSHFDGLRMHDQIQAMGRRIVLEENRTAPEKRSRLWSHEELLEAIEEPNGAKMLEVIRIESDIKQPLLYWKNFAMMSKLRFVEFSGVQVGGNMDFSYLPLSLKSFTLIDATMPATFYHRKLVHMNLSWSRIGEAWTNKPQNENERFQKLKALNLNGCDVSHESLDFSWFPYLETLNLQQCKNMVNLHKSIGHLKSLVVLNLSQLEIEELPNSICSLSSLKFLYLCLCTSLKNLPKSIGDLEALVMLDLTKTKIEEIPSSFYKLSCLKDLSLQGCSSLKNLPDSIGDLKSLVKLDLEGTKIEEIPSSIYKLSCLEVLILKDCSSLKNLPDSSGDLKSLVKLDSIETQNEEIPSRNCKLNKLPDLNCMAELVLSETKIKEVPDGVSLLPISWGRMRCLRIIDLSGTRILLPWDDSIIWLPNLVELKIGNNLESSLPTWISGLPQLQRLYLLECLKLESISNLPSTLRTLHVKDCISLQTLPDLSSQKHLSVLVIFSCYELKEIRGFEGAESLEELYLYGCNTITNTSNWQILWQGTLLVDEMSRGIENHTLNVNDGIDKGLIFCMVFDLPGLEEGELGDIYLSITVDIHRHQKHGRIRYHNDVVIEGVQYTGRKRDIIYIHHFKGFEWFGIPLQPGFDAIEVTSVNGEIFIPSRGSLSFQFEAKFWKILLENTASEQQQQITNQEEAESIITNARRMTTDFFNWSDDEDHGRSHHFDHTEQVRSSTHETIHHCTCSSNALETEESSPIVPQQADEESNDLWLGAWAWAFP